ncbi:MAG: conjugal transfer protein TraF [Alphaproteobacteria bacterium]|nr:conjugal transfer protein TraF [Alphaproteobacteria bacterium]
MWCFRLFFLVLPNVFMPSMQCAAGLGQPSVGQPSVEQLSPQGWLWYKDPSPELLRAQEKKIQTASENASQDDPKKVKDPKGPYQEKLTQLRETFEEAMAKSILVPTLQNVARTKQLHDQLIKGSEKFSELWTISALTETRGHEASTNLNPLNRRIYEQQKTQHLEQKLKKLSKDFGLFFVFKMDCPYCHQFVPLVVEFAEKFGFELKGISKEGGLLLGLQNTSKDNGILSLINPEGVYPALFLANPNTLEVIPIAWGMVSYTELLQNIETVLPLLEHGHVQ